MLTLDRRVRYGNQAHAREASWISWQTRPPLRRSPSPSCKDGFQHRYAAHPSDQAFAPSLRSTRPFAQVLFLFQASIQRASPLCDRACSQLEEREQLAQLLQAALDENATQLAIAKKRQVDCARKEERVAALKHACKTALGLETRPPWPAAAPLAAAAATAPDATGTAMAVSAGVAAAEPGTPPGSPPPGSPPTAALLAYAAAITAAVTAPPPALPATAAVGGWSRPTPPVMTATPLPYARAHPLPFVVRPGAPPADSLTFVLICCSCTERAPTCSTRTTTLPLACTPLRLLLRPPTTPRGRSAEAGGQPPGAIRTSGPPQARCPEEEV